ncbi:MAG: phosphoethanolamine transferase [Helicobacteraceae bacterium]|jgi:glucan phosphoethanolaminetransferase (alkaline phosphatase superfamily)|nr:phosphoethanolamine transferase [Helicobacteraceae bacterium]
MVFSPLKTVKFVAIALAAAVFELALHRALAYGPSQDGRMLFGFALILASRLEARSAKLVFALALGAIAFSVVGMEYGRLTPDFIGALMETNAEESKEFLSMINPLDILFACLLCALLAFALFAWRGQASALPSSGLRKYLRAFGFWTAIALLWIGSNPARLYSDAVLGYIEYRANLEAAQAIARGGAWSLSAGADKNDIRVVVIGESARKDYMSAYGYPLNTTPFLLNANGIFIDGFTTSAGYTIKSLSTILIKNENGVFDYGRNAVSLANAAGYETFWLSTQTYTDFKHIIARLSFQAAHSNFFRPRSLDFLSDDFNLIAELDEAIALDTGDKPKLIFMHIMGSHPQSCKRLTKSDPRSFNLIYGEDHNCYLATIEKLDRFISAATKRLEAADINWSLLYFSDHGLGHSGDLGDIKMRHNEEIRQSYEVPLFALGSGFNERVIIKRRLNASRFIDLFAAWIGARGEGLDWRYSLSDFPQDSDLAASGGKLGDLRDDPALY